MLTASEAAPALVYLQNTVSFALEHHEVRTVVGYARVPPITNSDPWEDRNTVVPSIERQIAFL